MAYLGTDGNLSDVTDEEAARAGQGGAPRLIEPGWYRCALIEDEAQAKEWGTGLSMQFQIIDGDFANYRVFEYLCIRHDTRPKAQQIAKAKLKAIAAAAGAKDPSNIEDTEEIYGKPLMLKVKREQQVNPTFADEDGCKAKIVAVLSVAEWRKEQVTAPELPLAKPVPAAHPALKKNPQKALYADKEIPF